PAGPRPSGRPSARCSPTPRTNRNSPPTGTPPHTPSTPPSTASPWPSSSARAATARTTPHDPPLHPAHRRPRLPRRAALRRRQRPPRHRPLPPTADHPLRRPPQRPPRRPRRRLPGRRLRRRGPRDGRDRDEDRAGLARHHGLRPRPPRRQRPRRAPLPRSPRPAHAQDEAGRGRRRPAPRPAPPTGTAGRRADQPPGGPPPAPPPPPHRHVLRRHGRPADRNRAVPRARWNRPRGRRPRRARAGLPARAAHAGLAARRLRRALYGHGPGGQALHGRVRADARARRLRRERGGERAAWQRRPAAPRRREPAGPLRGRGPARAGRGGAPREGGRNGPRQDSPDHPGAVPRRLAARWHQRRPPGGPRRRGRAPRGGRCGAPPHPRRLGPRAPTPQARPPRRPGWLRLLPRARPPGRRPRPLRRPRRPQPLHRRRGPAGPWPGPPRYLVTPTPMFKASSLLFLHAESGLHAGSGQSLGAIDLAIQRERYTNYPMIAASGVKGALRDWFSKNPERDDARLTAAFGPDTANASDHAGAVATTDARLLLFPVRSARGVFAWTTAPTALARLRRDLAMAGGPDLPALNALTDENVVFGSADCILHDDHGVLLEEFAFRFEPKAEVRALADWLAEHAVPRNDEYGFWRSRLPKQLLILPDDAFRDFVTHATEVQARVKLGPKKTTS